MSLPAISSSSRHPVLIVILTVVMALGGSYHELSAGPGDEIDRFPAPAISPQDITRDSGTGHYFLTTVIGGEIYELDADLKTVLNRIPSPFPEGGRGYNEESNTRRPRWKYVAQIINTHSMAGHPQ